MSKLCLYQNTHVWVRGKTSRSVTDQPSNTSHRLLASLLFLCQVSSWVSTPTSEASSGRTSRSGKSRIPRPISLPKRLEDKLSMRGGGSPQRAASAGGVRPVRGPVKSPVKPQVPPRPKSRVRDTVKLFDAKSNKALRPGARGTTGVRMRRPLKPTSPKTGGGEGMVDCDSGGDPFR